MSSCQHSEDEHSRSSQNEAHNGVIYFHNSVGAHNGETTTAYHHNEQPQHVWICTEHKEILETIYENPFVEEKELESNDDFSSNVPEYSMVKHKKPEGKSTPQTTWKSATKGKSTKGTKEKNVILKDNKKSVILPPSSPTLSEQEYASYCYTTNYSNNINEKEEQCSSLNSKEHCLVIINGTSCCGIHGCHKRKEDTLCCSGRCYVGKSKRPEVQIQVKPEVVDKEVPPMWESSSDVIKKTWRMVDKNQNVNMPIVGVDACCQYSNRLLRKSDAINGKLESTNFHIDLSGPSKRVDYTSPTIDESTNCNSPTSIASNLLKTHIRYIVCKQLKDDKNYCNNRIFKPLNANKTCSIMADTSSSMGSSSESTRKSATQNKTCNTRCVKVVQEKKKRKRSGKSPAGVLKHGIKRKVA